MRAFGALLTVVDRQRSTVSSFRFSVFGFQFDIGQQQPAAGTALKSINRFGHVEPTTEN
jgi:hypothetical protein